MKPVDIIMKMLNKSAARDSSIMEDFSNPRVGMKMKLHTKLASPWVTKNGLSVSNFLRTRLALFLRVMEHPFLIVLNGTPKIGQNAQIVYIL